MCLLRLVSCQLFLCLGGDHYLLDGECRCSLGSSGVSLPLGDCCGDGTGDSCIGLCGGVAPSVVTDVTGEVASRETARGDDSGVCWGLGIVEASRLLGVRGSGSRGW